VARVPLCKQFHGHALNGGSLLPPT
jgi:hypothetical protein